ncbi:hypothetical protein niasHT_040087 [Heterodera trifolii]|uniref:Integrase catalytic domain-containing protein n=1 Tax=Heterodera trifolii TaxID=157864 RepID=A0ABD2J676_9BILA
MRPRRINFPRSRTTAAGFMTDCQVDLADFQALSRHNSGNRYLMVLIDVLSKRIFVTPLRTKKADDMVEGFKQLFSQMPMKPHRIFSDKGTEFKNQQLKKLFDEEEVEKYESNHSEKKAALAERAIRQIKNRVYRYFAQLKTLNWVDVIDKIVNGINKSPSRVHGMRPIDVNFKNSQKVWEKMFGADQHRALFGKHRKRPKFIPDQTVRMSIAKGQFEKGYIPNYGDEILEIDAVKRHTKPMRYKLRDAKGEKFKGFFYPEELTPVRKEADTTYRIERVFRKRKRADGTMEKESSIATTISSKCNRAKIATKCRFQYNIKRQSTNITATGSTSSFPKPTAPLPVSIVPDQSVSQKNIPPPPVSNPSINVTKKQEGVKSSSGLTHSVSKPPAPLPVTNQTTVSQPQQIVVAPPAQRNATKPQSAISEVNQKEIGPPPEQRNVKNTVERVSTPKQPLPVAPTHSNVTAKKATSPPRPIAIDYIGPTPKQRSEKGTVETVSPSKHPLAAPPTPSNATEKKATSPPRAILTDYIGPPPKQRNEKSLNTKQGPTQLVTELTPENAKKTTTITTTTTTTITEPPKDTIGDLVGRIGEPSERNNAEQLLSVLFGDEEWKKINLRILRQIIEGVELQYHQNFERFKAVFTDPRIEYISFSPQLGYVLGFENHQNVRNNEIAKYGSDLRGGFASFAVYAKGLTENMIVGNSLSSLLRVVSVSGAVPGEYTEKIYDSPLYARVLPKEVLEIEIELRTMTDGRLVPFSYGTVLIVLIFKKARNRFSADGALHKRVQE